MVGTPNVRRVCADGRIMGAGAYADALAVRTGDAWLVKFAGIAAVDPETRVVVGYEAHNGAYAPDALELQVADIFRQLERLMEAVAREIGRQLTLCHLTEATAYLRDRVPRTFERFNDAYIHEFGKRDIGEYPARTTVMDVTLPEPAALVEITFEAVASA